ncbi:hypothetical protein PR048_015218 [Dryococelus australis]|uniref:Uncharacterized protein n=1 Tax=Dryococelus australis TaxID=614101 RepID=A0ABQ9HGL7_9NEOP|nr:hypothetical protein PR048_015218 [Dryococelus australis]
MRGQGKREIPDKTHPPAASSGTVSTCENPMTQPGIELGDNTAAIQRQESSEAARMCRVLPAALLSGLCLWVARSLKVVGAMVTERLARSPPTKASRVQSPAWSPDFRKCESCRMMSLVYLGIFRFPRPLHSGAAPYLLQSPSLALKTSLLRATQISSLTKGCSRSNVQFRNESLEKALPPPAYILTSALSDIRLVKLVTMEGKSTQKTVAPFEFRAGLEIEMKLISNHRNWRFDISIRDQQPSSTNIDESEIQNNENSLVQHFCIGTKIKLDPGSELGSSVRGSGKMMVQPGKSLWKDHGQSDATSHQQHVGTSDRQSAPCNIPCSQANKGSSAARGSSQSETRPVPRHSRRLLDNGCASLKEHPRRFGGVVVRLLASHLGEPGSIHGGSCRTIPLVGGFSQGSPVFPAPSFRRCSMPTSLRPYRLSRPQSENPPWRNLGANSRLSDYKSATLPLSCKGRASTPTPQMQPYIHPECAREIRESLNIEFLRADEGEARWEWISPGMQGRGQMGDPRENLLTSGIARHDSHASGSSFRVGREKTNFATSVNKSSSTRKSICACANFSQDARTHRLRSIPELEKNFSSSPHA